jgi:hypothetical protein
MSTMILLQAYRFFPNRRLKRLNSQRNRCFSPTPHSLPSDLCEQKVNQEELPAKKRPASSDQVSPFYAVNKILLNARVFPQTRYRFSTGPWPLSQTLEIQHQRRIYSHVSENMPLGTNVILHKALSGLHNRVVQIGSVSVRHALTEMGYQRIQD